MMDTNTLIYLEYIRKVMAELPGTREGICYGTQGFYFQKKLLARMKEDGETLAIPVADRTGLIKANPAVFSITPHYDNSNYVLVSLEKIPPQQLTQLLIDSFLVRATKSAIKEYRDNQNK